MNEYPSFKTLPSERELMTVRLQEAKLVAENKDYSMKILELEQWCEHLNEQIGRNEDERAELKFRLQEIEKENERKEVLGDLHKTSNKNSPLISQKSSIIEDSTIGQTANHQNSSGQAACANDDTTSSSAASSNTKNFASQQSNNPALKSQITKSESIPITQSNSTSQHQNLEKSSLKSSISSTSQTHDKFNTHSQNSIKIEKSSISTEALLIAKKTALNSSQTIYEHNKHEMSQSRSSKSHSRNQSCSMSEKDEKVVEMLNSKVKNLGSKKIDQNDQVVENFGESRI